MELLKSLLAESHSGNYAKVGSAIADFLKGKTNAKVVIQKVAEGKENVLAVFGKPELLINCHMDTVKPSGKWKHTPLDLVEEEGKIFGLGTADTKGNIYCVLKAVEKAKPNNLLLLFSVDEEGGENNGVSFFLKSEFCRGIKYAIVCEPTSLEFVNKHKGHYSFNVEVETEPFHSSQKGEAGGASAIVKAAELILKLEKAGFSVGKIVGGSQDNVVAGHCEFVASIRSNDEAEEALEKIRGIVNGKGIKVAWKAVGKPLKAGEKFPFVEGEMHEVGFWTDAAQFQEAGIGTVVFGAGNVKQAHTCNEFVEKKELEDAQTVFEKIMGEF